MAAGGHVEILPAFEREGGGPGEFNLPFGSQQRCPRSRAPAAPAVVHGAQHWFPHVG